MIIVTSQATMIAYNQWYDQWLYIIDIPDYYYDYWVVIQTCQLYIYGY